MSKKECIGLVINTAVRPSCAITASIMSYAQHHLHQRPRIFHGSAATSPCNIAAFAAVGISGLIFCGINKGIILKFLRLMPNHPPVVVCAHSMFQKSEFAQLENGGMILLDNVEIGRMAADCFLGHGMRNFAFFGSKEYRSIAGEIRCAAFRDRIEERLGKHAVFSSLIAGNVEANEDSWNCDAKTLMKFLSKLSLPCGILANGDHDAFELTDVCRRMKIDVPDQIEIIGINNSTDLCEQSLPTLSSIFPNYEQCANEAIEMLLGLARNPNLPPERRCRTISGSKLIERSSTLSGKGYGGIVVRAREYIRLNACTGISVSDVAGHLGISRRTLEKRVMAATGQSVREMIGSIRLERVCHLLKTTDMSILEVTLQAGYQPTSNLSTLFKRTYGLSMREFRKSFAQR